MFMAKRTMNRRRGKNKVTRRDWGEGREKKKCQPKAKIP
jgi:hypothetical protein